MNEIRNSFVWDLTEEDWKKYPEEMLRNLDAFDCYNTAGVVGSCRIGDLCFDFRAWGDENGAVMSCTSAGLTAGTTKHRTDIRMIW